MTEAAKKENTENTVEETAVVEPKIDSLGRAQAVGKRKSSIARVWVKPGNGKIIVNGKECDKYFTRGTHVMMINQPFEVTKREGQFDVECTVGGGGQSGQAGAVRHGISRALNLYEPALRGPLKSAGFLTRDARKVERKKPGARKARRKKQFSKR